MTEEGAAIKDLEGDAVRWHAGKRVWTVRRVRGLWPRAARTRTALNSLAATLFVLGVAGACFLAGRASNARDAAAAQSPDQADWAAQASRSGPAHAAPSIEPALATLRDALLQARPSVYLVCQRGRQGGLTPVATAWSVGPSLLATAGHVAWSMREALTEDEGDADGESLDEDAEPESQTADESEAEDDGEAAFLPQFVIRSAAADGEDLVITGVYVHPGYERWAGIARRCVMRAGADGPARVKFVSPCDVALLEVNGEVGPPLPLAEKDELQRLACGDAVGYVGYPNSAVRFDPLRTPPTLYLGHVQGLTSPFGLEAAPADVTTLQHDLVNNRGSSGSPIFGAAGAVIAMHTASATTGCFLCQSPIGIHFAQRIDLLCELLDGTADERQAERDVRWRAELASVSMSPDEIMDAFLDSGLKQLRSHGDVAPHQPPELLGEYAALIVPGEDAANTYSLHVEPRFIYGFLACASDWSDIDVEVSLGEQLEDDTYGDYYPTVWFAPQDVGMAELRVYASETTFPDSLAHVRIYRVRRLPPPAKLGAPTVLPLSLPHVTPPP